jgi:hypothetical protein
MFHWDGIAEVAKDVNQEGLGEHRLVRALEVQGYFDVIKMRSPIANDCPM